MDPLGFHVHDVSSCLVLRGQGGFPSSDDLGGVPLKKEKPLLPLHHFRLHLAAPG